MDAFDIIQQTMKEFEKVPPETIKVFISLAEPLVSKKRFGGLYPQALAYLTAHKLKMSGYGTQSGIGTIADSLRVSSYSEGEASISFSTNQQSNLQKDAEYALTTYGLQFLTLRRKCIVPIVSAGEVRTNG